MNDLQLILDPILWEHVKRPAAILALAVLCLTAAAFVLAARSLKRRGRK